MAVEFKLPDLGEGIHEAEILAIKVDVGQTVKEDDIIFEVETDKAVVEIPCPVAGLVQKIHVKVGEVAKVGNVMITFETVAVPAGGSGGHVAATSNKASKEPAVAAKASGNGKSQAAAQQAVIQAVPAVTALATGPVPAAPATRRLARELGVDLRMVSGSGPAGRVTKEDIRAYAEGVVAGPRSGSCGFGGGVPPVGKTVPSRHRPAATTAFGYRMDEKPESSTPGGPFTVPDFEMPDFTRYGNVERVPLRSLRRKIAQNMVQSWTHVPHVTHFDEIDITDTEYYRARHEKAIADKGGKLTITVLMLKAVVAGLRKHMQFNSSLDESTSEIILKQFFNIGIAVATERGLIVPVVKDVDQKSIVELSCELAEIAQKTRDGKVELERLQGGTFTITNIGAIGGTGMVPMVNYPEVGILGMARAQLKPVVRDGKIEIRNIMNVALSFDHRVADGADAAMFVRHIKNCLEDPFQLLLEV